MGCSSPNAIEEQKNIPLEIQMEAQKRDLMVQIEENNIKIMNLENEIQKMDSQIRDGENDIKLNQFQLKENELKAKAKKLIDMQRDKARNQRSLDSLRGINETMKNNLENLERKLEEHRNIKALKQGNEIMNQYNRENNAAILANNANQLLDQRAKDEQTKKIIERGNNAYVGNDNLRNEDEYLKELLGNGTTKGF